MRTRGWSKHSCIHKYFYEKSVFYVPDQQQPTEAEQQQVAPPQVQNNPNAQASSSSSAAINEQSAESKADLFTNDPITRKELDNEALIRGRLTTLLKASPNNLIRSENLLLSMVGLRI